MQININCQVIYLFYILIEKTENKKNIIPQFDFTAHNLN